MMTKLPIQEYFLKNMGLETLTDFCGLHMSNLISLQCSQSFSLETKKQNPLYFQEEKKKHRNARTLFLCYRKCIISFQVELFHTLVFLCNDLINIV